jgi:undecaprenyl-diphosphatase
MVASFLSAVTAFIAAHPHFAYAAVLLLALSESIAIVGVVVPASAIILGISALVPAGAVSLWPLLAAATAGGIIGDGVSYWIGHRYHREILDNWPLKRYRALIARSEAYSCLGSHLSCCGDEGGRDGDRLRVHGFECRRKSTSRECPDS